MKLCSLLIKNSILLTFSPAVNRNLPVELTVPWEKGRPLVWDFTCSNTLADSHLEKSIYSPGGAALAAEEAKKKKYQNISEDYIFLPNWHRNFRPMGPLCQEIPR